MAERLLIPRDRLEPFKQAVLARATINRMKNSAIVATPIADHAMAAEVEACRGSFVRFLRHWRFINRETGQVTTFEELWPGQQEAAALMIAEPWLFLLKAGKLGFTELECAYDGWIARFGPPNSLVGLFSRGKPEAQSLLAKVKFGLRHLPQGMRLPSIDGPGGDTSVSLILAGGAEDIREIRSYAAVPGTAIDQTFTHAHLDELSHVRDPEGIWGTVSTTISPSGSCHIVTRGAGAGIYTAKLWKTCSNLGGNGKLHGHFSDAFQRPGRGPAWYEAEAATMLPQALLYYAPMTPQDALAGDDTSVYIPVSVWDRCRDPYLVANPLLPGDKTPAIVSVDASVSGDMFAITVVTRHPERREDPAIRIVFAFNPREETGGHVDYDKAERFIRWLICGGCPQMHPKAMPLIGQHDVLGAELTDCPECVAGNFGIPGLNVVCLVYDPYQMEDIAQHLNRDGIVWAEPFDQGKDRLIADATLYQVAMSQRLGHEGSPLLREHVQNAKAKIQPGDYEDSKMRMVKSGEGKIDALVSASMGVSMCLSLNI